jgi:pimeloyl-ACP methyl ester carboxylesterase
VPHATVGGLRLYYDWHGDGPGPPLVLVMGLGGDSTAWPFQLAAFRRRHRCLVLDNRGAGRSDAPDVPFTVRDMAADLLGLLDAVGVERAHLLGVSLGGAIAQEAALAAPGRVASLQLHATWAGRDPWLEAVVTAFRLARAAMAPEAFVRATLPWLFSPAAFTEQAGLLELIVQTGARPSHVAPLHGYLRQAGAALAHDARDRLPGLRVPALVAVGEEDLLTPPRFARELAGLIPGARLALIPGGHGALWERPEAFNQVGLGFLASLGEDGGGRGA